MLGDFNPLFRTCRVSRFRLQYRRRIAHEKIDNHTAEHDGGTGKDRPKGNLARNYRGNHNGDCGNFHRIAHSHDDAEQDGDIEFLFIDAARKIKKFKQYLKHLSYLLVFYRA